MSDEVEVLPREFVERLARIVGPASAAQQALDCANSGTHGDDPVFVRPIGKGGHSIIVTPRSNLTPLGEKGQTDRP